MKLIGLSGKAGSGKDTVAKYLVEKYGFEAEWFARPLKLYIGGAIFGLEYHQLWGKQEDKEKIDPRYGLSPRQILQMAGMKLREIYPDIWVDKLFDNIVGLDRVVIPDVRYVNEVEAIHRAGGEVWRIDRDGAGASAVELASHASEIELDNYQNFDIIIENNGTKEELFKKIDEVMRGDYKRESRV